MTTRKPRSKVAVYDHTHGIGWNAIIACVILQAIRDASHGDTDAEAWLTSARCGDMLDFLDLPGVEALTEARHRQQYALYKIKFARRGIKPRIRLAKGRSA